MDPLVALRQLTSLDGLMRRGRSAPRDPVVYPWAALADLAVVHGTGPLVAYAMEYRLGGGGAPEEIHDALLGYYHGTLTDNVYKLVQLKKLLSGAADVPVVLVGAAAYVDALYPHVAFRPLPELRLVVRRPDFPKLAAAGEPLDMRIEGEEEGAALLTDGRTRLLLHDSLFGASRSAAEDELFERGAAAKVFGPKVRRPSIEDALLAHLALIARAGFVAPLIEYVDLRELVRGAPAQQGVWDRPPDAVAVKARAQALSLSRALWCAMQVLAHFFPEVRSEAAALSPDLPADVRASPEAGVVGPAQKLERASVEREAEEARKLLG
jgi:hypothetical protein